MKKLIAAVSLLLLITAAGCNNNKDNNESSSAQDSVSEESSQTSLSGASEDEVSTESSNSTDSGEALLSKYTNIDSLSDKSKKAMTDFLSSKEFTIEAEGSLAAAKGLTVKFSSKIVKGEAASYAKTSFMNIEYVTLRTKEGIYSIDEDSKTAVLTPLPKEGETLQDISIIDKAKQALPAFQTFEYDNLSFIKSGDEEYEGSTFFCEEYSAGEFTLKLYYDGDDLKYITSEKDGLVSVLTITNKTNTADKNLLQIPSGYTVK